MLSEPCPFLYQILACLGNTLVNLRCALQFRQMNTTLSSSCSGNIRTISKLTALCQELMSDTYIKRRLVEACQNGLGSFSLFALSLSLRNLNNPLFELNCLLVNLFQSLLYHGRKTFMHSTSVVTGIDCWYFLALMSEGFKVIICVV